MKKSENPEKSVLKTPRLILRPWQESDAEELYRYAKDPQIGPACGWNPHRSVAESAEIIKKVLSVPGTYAVTERPEAEAPPALTKPIGSIGIFQSRADGAAPGDMEIGYWIGRPYWGRGLIPEAVNAMVDRCFSETDCRTIWCGYFDGNEKSRRVQEKCGFVYHHTRPDFFREPNGEKKTEHFTTLTRQRWLDRKQKEPGNR